MLAMQSINILENDVSINNMHKQIIFILEAEVKNEVQDCPENDSVPGGELYIDENAEEKEQEYPDSLEKTDYGSLYGANQYYNRYLDINLNINIRLLYN